MRIFRLAQQEFVGIDRYYADQEIEACRGTQQECWDCLMERFFKQHGVSWDFAVKNNLAIVMPAEEWISQGVADSLPEI